MENDMEIRITLSVIGANTCPITNGHRFPLGA